MKGGGFRTVKIEEKGVRIILTRKGVPFMGSSKEEGGGL